MKKLFFLLSCIILFSCSNHEDSTYSRTILGITNDNSDSVLVYLTLNSGTQNVENVNGIFGISDSGLQGSLYLCSLDTLYYLSPEGKSISGNITFGTPPLNCADTTFPNGINIFEFALNDDFTSKSQETVDISCVAGVNSIGGIHLSGGGEWIATTGVTNIKNIKNDSLYANLGNIGVFPYGCDDCTASVSPPSCPNHKPYAKPQLKPICNISRNASESGGQVIVSFTSYSGK